MEAMSAPLPSRHTPFLQQGLRLPSLPIPIPARRVTTNPPPRSPDRGYSSSDLVFEMSPVALEDAPIKGFQSSQCSTMPGEAYQRRPYMPFPRLAACSRSPEDSVKPYPHEPFLYSIPKLPSRISQAHGRSQSEVVSPTQLSPPARVEIDHCDLETESLSLPCSQPASAYSLEHVYECKDQLCAVYAEQNALTSAFQHSVSSGTPSTTSSFPPSPLDGDAVPSGLPSSSKLDVHGCIPSTPLLPVRRRANFSKGTYPTGITRTSAAAPVLSFAQVELDNTGLFARETRVGRNKPKSPPCLVSGARSPYPLVRGRRNSILRERSMRFSDEDISGTLRRDGVYEKFGLEKYLPAGMQKRNARDENTISDVLVEKERGRTRSRARGGLRP